MKHFSLKKRYYTLFLSLFSVAILSSCATLTRFEATNVQTGLASWYGPKFHGKMTSSGEKYNMYQLTAAHQTLPFGAYVKITNRLNGKSVRVRINDRGPFIKGRIIDLSYAAAKVIDMIGPGVVPVRVEILSHIKPSDLKPSYCVQAGAFLSKKNAHRVKRKLSVDYGKVYIVKHKKGEKTYYQVRIRARNLKSAEKIAKRLRKKGYRALPLSVSSL
ncbi:MAG: septal ring lytic transglycosylase RlpA family protein [Candidatus Aminicenantales bacterium]